MKKNNDFRLSYKTAFLFVLSNEYNIPFVQMMNLYNLSELIFWSYMEMFSNMSKMGVRKASQLSKIANRIYKKNFGFKDKKERKVEVDKLDIEGNVMLDDKGNPRKDKIIKFDYFEILLTPQEQRLLNLLKYYTTTGFSDGNEFLTDEELMDMYSRIDLSQDIITLEGRTFGRCKKIDYVLERYFPELSMEEYRTLSIKGINEMFAKVEAIESELSEDLYIEATN